MNAILEFMERNTKRAWVLIILLPIAIMASWVTDDELPFTVVSVDTAVGRAGELIKLGADVRRDVSRGCSVKISRRLFLPNGSYLDYDKEVFYGADEIRDLAARFPNRLQITILLPLGIPPGQYELVNRLQYVCNPWHRFRPIEGSSVLPFTVEPSQP